MFDRFSDRARRVVVLAQEEARFLNHNYIGTEHLLLGLLHEGHGVAALTLTDLGVDLDTVRDRVRDLIGLGSRAPSGHIPFTPRAKRVLELSLYEAKELGHNEISTEHLLLGVMVEGEGVAAQVLGALDVTADRVRDRVLELHGQVVESGPVTPEAKNGPSVFEQRIADLERRVTELEQRLGGAQQNDASA